MKLTTLSISLCASLFASAAFAQVPAGAPAGTTGVCKDGTFTSVESKAGACSGHKGVKTWIATSATAMSTNPKTAAPVTGATTAAMPDTKTAAARTSAPAAGAGPDKVWVNTDSKVYHCPGTKYYGKTKKGAYMTEAEATAAGNHADHKKACNK